MNLRVHFQKDDCMGHFILFSVNINIYNKKTKGPTLMELFTATGKLKKFFFDNWRRSMCAPRMTQHTSIWYSSSCHTCVNMGASIFFTAAMIRAFRSVRSCGNGGIYCVHPTIAMWPPCVCRHGSLQQWIIFMHPCWCMCGKNLNIVLMCAVSNMMHTSDISSCQKNFSSFPVAVNYSIKVSLLIFLL
jgi:hypothetical protein